MENLGNKRKEAALQRRAADDATADGLKLHPAWEALIRYCRELGHGEIERIKVQDGLPVSVEVITKRIRLC